MTDTMREYPFFVGGEWRENPDPVMVRSPYDGRPVGLVHQARERDMEDATVAAAVSFAELRTLSSARRSAVLASMADRIEERSEELAAMLVLEAGKTRLNAAAEVRRGALTLRISAEEARRIGGELIDLDWTEETEGRIGILRRFPIGPVLGITPFNFPLNIACHKIGPALAAGNPVILKPASATPVSALLLAEIAEASGIPDGALSVLPCPGSRAEVLVKDDRIAALNFTGSADVGWRLREMAGRKKVILELGGNAAVIVHHDCPDLDYAAARIVAGGFANAGQVCISVQRVLVHEDIYEEMRGMILARVRNLRTGDPDSDQTDVGPLIDDAAAKRAEELVQSAVRDGASPLCGGERRGRILSPAVVTGTSPGMRIEHEEAFAPLITVNPYQSFSEALARANTSTYGLQLGVFTSDINRVMTAFAESRVGGVVINDIPGFRADHMPYGGVKGSGTGKEGPRYAIREMTEEKLLVITRMKGA
ncbi:MAG: aldehyde dehydrogenase family protein [Methanoregulaceae archaeon]|nr:aldehyde dehydrogenase family protein [Methanoregulaceae archaeon]